jgi:hypothetical protein
MGKESRLVTQIACNLENGAAASSLLETAQDEGYPKKIAKLDKACSLYTLRQQKRYISFGRQNITKNRALIPRDLSFHIQSSEYARRKLAMNIPSEAMGNEQ